MLIDVRPDLLAEVLQILKTHVPDCTVYAFGSRVKWTAKDTSDLDLCIQGPEKLSLLCLSKLKDALSLSRIPYKVDVVDWYRIDDSFRQLIEPDWQAIYPVEPTKAHNKTMAGEWKSFLVQKLIDEKIIAVGDGYRAKNLELSKNGYPFARAGNINNGFHFEEADCFPEKQIYKVGEKISRVGDVVFTSKGTVGRFAFVNEKTPPFVYSPQLCYWRSLNTNCLDSKYLFYWLQGPEFTLQANGVKGQTDMAEYVSLTDQRRFNISLPPLPKQKTIASVLGVLDDKIELNRQMNETMEAMAKALFKSWFVDFDPVRAKAEGRQPAGLDPAIAALFPDEFEESELGEIPKGWEINMLGNIADVGWGDTSVTKASYIDSGYKAFSASGQDGFLSYYDYNQKGIVVSAIGANAGVTWLTSGQWSCIKNTIRFWSQNETELSTEYLYFYTLGKEKWPLRGSAQPFISQSDARRLKILTPSNSLGGIFGELVTSIFKKITLKNEEILQLAELRDILLPKLMSGEIPVQKAENLLERARL